MPKIWILIRKYRDGFLAGGHLAHGWTANIIDAFNAVESRLDFKGVVFLRERFKLQGN